MRRFEWRQWMLCAAALAIVASCARQPTEHAPTPPPVAAPPPAQPVTPQKKAIVLSWDDVPARRAWSAALIDAIREHKAELDRGDPEGFAPGYAALSQDDQVKFWAELVIAIAKYESNWNPRARFKEPPPLHVVAIGLLQLSYEDGAEYRLDGVDRAKRSLEDPVVNLRCGVAILARLVARDGVIAAGSGDRARGAAHFWAVLREGKRHHLQAIKTMTRRASGLA